MDWLNSGALPMGMLFFGIMVFTALRRKAGNVVARAQYPGLAHKLGLSYRAPKYKTGVGKLEGPIDGFFVSVDPDDQRRIFIRFSSAPEVRLTSYVHNKRAPGNLQTFRPRTSVLSNQFKTAQAAPPMRDRFEAAEVELSKNLRPLSFIRELKGLSVSEGGITAVFDYGNPPFIPAGIVEDVLPRLLVLARVFESPSSGGTGLEQARKAEQA